MLELVRGNKLLLGVEIYSPDDENRLIEDLEEVTSAKFLIKVKKTDPESRAIVVKQYDSTYGIMLNAIKYERQSAIMPGITCEVTSSAYLHIEAINLVYTVSTTSLTFGDGTPVNISSGGRFKVENNRGDYVIIWVTPSKLSTINCMASISMINSIGKVVIRLDSADTATVNPRDYFFGLQIVWPWETQEILIDENIIRIDLDIVGN
jgi:hypothetical protein